MRNKQILGASAVILSLASLCALPGAAVAQERQEEEKPWVELSFSRVSGRAGEEVRVPIYVTSNVNLNQAFTISISFPSGKLEFKSLEKGLLAQKAGWTLEAAVKDSEKDPAVLEIPVQMGDGKVFPNGVIAYARFEIKKHVANGDISLAASLKLSPGPALVQVKVEPGKVAVFDKPIYGCFFYMH